MGGAKFVHMLKSCTPLIKDPRSAPANPCYLQTKTNPLLRYLESSYNTAVLTATTVTKAAATKAAMTCSPGEVRILTEQMSHSVDTNRKLYEEVNTAEGEQPSPISS